jgi:hypothetical protein
MGSVTDKEIKGAVTNENHSQDENENRLSPTPFLGGNFPRPLNYHSGFS